MVFEVFDKLYSCVLSKFWPAVHKFYSLVTRLILCNGTLVNDV